MSAESEATYKEPIRDLLIEDIQWTGTRAEMTDDLPLIENQLIDSLGVMRLVARLESDFGITIQDEDVVLANLGSIDRIAAFVAGIRASGP